MPASLSDLLQCVAGVGAVAETLQAYQPVGTYRYISSDGRVFVGTDAHGETREMLKLRGLDAKRMKDDHGIKIYANKLAAALTAL